MAATFDPLTRKQSFLEKNKLISEIELTDESKSIGKLHQFDVVDSEIWLLQCPKGMDISELENQTLKIPGRSNVNSSEAISMEFNEGNEQRAFAYLNRKGRYDLRLLPVRGTIVVRDRLKAAANVDEQRAEECCPTVKRVPVPSTIRVRHPLLGVQYEDKLKLDKSILDRLQKADKISAHILKESLRKRSTAKHPSILEKSSRRECNISFPIEINSADDDGVELISVEKLKKNKKRKSSDSNADVHVSDNISKNKTKKLRKSNIKEEYVSEDLQWLKNI